MAENSTVARPYAKAIFEHAYAGKKLADWSLILEALSEAILNLPVRDFISNPMVTASMQSELLKTIFVAQTQERESINNTIELLAHNKRLMLLPEIVVQYNALRAQQEKTLTVAVLSFDVLTSAEERALVVSLSKRLQREVALDVTLDKSLLGGAVITAGDLVIDGSVRGQLDKLRTDLVA